MPLHALQYHDMADPLDLQKPLPASAGRMANVVFLAQGLWITSSLRAGQAAKSSTQSVLIARMAANIWPHKHLHAPPCSPHAQLSARCPPALTCTWSARTPRSRRRRKWHLSAHYLVRRHCIVLRLQSALPHPPLQSAHMLISVSREYSRHHWKSVCHIVTTLSAAYLCSTRCFQSLPVHACTRQLNRPLLGTLHDTTWCTRVHHVRKAEH
jgi:hypothetical protein